jgi:hypothetical protein
MVAAGNPGFRVHRSRQRNRTCHGRQPATTPQLHLDSTAFSGCLHMNVQIHSRMIHCGLDV